MPYIVPKQRAMLDPLIKQLSCMVGDLCEPENGTVQDPDGMLNYVFTKMLIDMGLSRYIKLERAVGILECCKLELYRKAAAPYEDKKALDNGEVYQS